MGKNKNQTMMYFLLAFQMLAGLAFVYGLFSFTFTEWLSVVAIYFVTGCLGVSITYHRLLSHNAFKVGRWYEIFGTLCATYGLVGSSLAWVNNHRAHHRFADTRDDPHAPTFLGFQTVQWLSMFTSSTRLMFIKKLLRDRFHVLIHRNYILIHILILSLWLIFGSVHAAAVYYLAPAFVLWHMGSLINTICHSRFGYRNFDVNDLSKNNLVLGFIVWGEGWHNNHHKQPFAKKYGVKWWEFDISYLIIRMIENEKPI